MYCSRYRQGAYCAGYVLEAAVMLLRIADKANDIDYLKIQAIGRKEGEHFYYK